MVVFLRWSRKSYSFLHLREKLPVFEGAFLSVFSSHYYSNPKIHDTMLRRSIALDVLLCCIVFFSISPANSASTSCTSPLEPPVEIPIRNITLPDQLLRGAALSVGSPLQNFAFQVDAFVFLKLK